MFISKFKKAISAIIATAMAVSVISSVPAVAQTGITTYNYSDFTVEYNVQNEWTGYQSVDIKVTNTGTKPIYNWALKYDAGGEITGIYNGVVVDNDGTKYVIKNAGYNYEIAPNAFVNFGYTLAGDNLVLPEKFENFAKRVDISEGFGVQLDITNSWDVGFNGFVTLANTSDNPLEAWMLSFDTNFDIYDVWGATLLETNGNHYNFSSQFMSNPIQPGASVQIGIGANMVSGTTPAISNNVVSVVRIGEITDEDDGDDDDSDGNYDDDVELIDIGEIYFKDITSDEEVDYDGNGIFFVRNQILLTAYNQVSFESIATLAESFNAEIVGYIELTNDYQLEINGDVSTEYLYQLIEDLKSNSLIEYVSLNTAFELEEEAILETYQPPVDVLWNDVTKTTRTLKGRTKENWNIHAINAPVAWGYLQEMSTVKIGLIDNYFDTNHNKLRFGNNRVWNNKLPTPHDFTADVKTNKEGHGTHVAGIMAAFWNETDGIAGVCPKNTLYGYSMNGDSKNTLSVIKKNTVMQYKYALALLIGNGVRVVNISMAFTPEMNFGVSRGNDKAINAAREGADTLNVFLNKLLTAGYDFIIVQGAGNSNAFKFSVDNDAKYGYKHDEENGTLSGGVNASCASYFAYIGQEGTTYTQNVIDHIIIVGSIAPINTSYSTFKYSDFSNIGDRVDILAPGSAIYSCVPGEPQNGSTPATSPYALKSGTSMATPHISGVAGMLYSINSKLTGTQVKNCIVATSTESVGGDPLVNAGAAVKKVWDDKGKTSETPTTPTFYVTVTGLIQPVGKSGEFIPDVNVKISRPSSTGSSKEFSATSDAQGQYVALIEMESENTSVTLTISVDATDKYERHSTEIQNVTASNNIVYVQNISLTTIGSNIGVEVDEDDDNEVSSVEKPLDITFIVYANSTGTLNSIKTKLTAAVEEIYSRQSDVRINFVIYTGGRMQSTKGLLYADDLETATNIIGRLPVSQQNRFVNSLVGATEFDWRDNAEKLCFIIDNAVEPTGMNATIPAIDDLIDNGVKVRFICNAINDNAIFYRALSMTARGGLHTNPSTLDQYVISQILGA